jgi:putative sterol carrier protein
MVHRLNAVLGATSEAHFWMPAVVDGGHWHVDLKNGSGSVGNGLRDDANATLSMKSANFIKIFNGKLSSTTAFMTGRLKIDGVMMMAMKLEKIIKNLNKSKL